MGNAVCSVGSFSRKPHDDRNRPDDSSFCFHETAWQFIQFLEHMKYLAAAFALVLCSCYRTNFATIDQTARISGKNQKA